MNNNNGNLQELDALAIFNTIIGMSNMKKNTIAQEHIEEIYAKVDIILKKVEGIEGRLEEFENKG